MIGMEFIFEPVESFLDLVNMLLTVVSMIPPVFGVLLTLALITLLIRLLPL